MPLYPTRSVASPYLVLALLLGCLATAPASVFAAPINVPDQQQTSDNGQNALAGPRWQTFVPGLTGLDVVELKLSGSGIVDGVQEVLQVQIHDGAPTGAVLGSSLQVVLPDAFVMSVVHFDFPSVVSLTPGNSYAIQLAPVSPTSTSRSVRLSVLSDLYPSGQYYTSPEAPSSGSGDMWFRTGLHVPEPSTLALSAAALLALSYSAWRRKSRSLIPRSTR
jgi:hypothetical protein